MTKTEFMRKLFKSQIMPDASIRTYQNGAVTRIYMRQEDAPNCGLSNHNTEAGLRKALVTYLRWFAEYVETFAEMVDADHGEALEINETLDIIADEQAEAAAVVNAVDTDIAVGIAHAEALEENKRFDNLLARFVQFKRWYPSVQRSLIAVAHADALELDKAYDEANAEPDAMPLRWVQMFGRADRLPFMCRCAMGRPVFEPVILDLRQLYGEALRDYWQFASEEDRAELIEEQHALALAMNVQRDFYRLPLILRLVAVGVDHLRALRMNRQHDFFQMPLYQRVSEIEWAHFEALAMDQHHDALAAIIRRNIEAMPAIIRMTFELK